MGSSSKQQTRTPRHSFSTTLIPFTHSPLLPSPAPTYTGSGEIDYKEMNRALRSGMTTQKLGGGPKPPGGRPEGQSPRRATIA